MNGPDLATWRQQGERIELSVGDSTVNVFRRVAGSNSAGWLTLLHGWPTTSWDGAPIADTLEEQHRTLTFDWPGLGASDKGDGVAYDIDALTDTLLSLWAHEDVTSTRIVAHDVGTIVAQELLARRLDGDVSVDIESVVWLNGSLYPDLYRPTDTQLALLDPDTGPALAAAINADLYTLGVAGVHHPDHQPDADTLTQYWKAFGGEAGAAEMPRFLRYIPEREARIERLVGAIERTDVAQRFVWGLADPVSGDAQVERIRERFGDDVDLVAYDDCSHYPHTERPDDVAAQILRPW